jgi:hypothetical protein
MNKDIVITILDIKDYMEIKVKKEDKEEVVQEVTLVLLDCQVLRANTGLKVLKGLIFQNFVVGADMAILNSQYVQSIANVEINSLFYMMTSIITIKKYILKLKIRTIIILA